MAKVLIVDDEPAMVMVLTEALKSRQHEPLSALTPESALRLVREQLPDLVLADVEMPGGQATGLELLRAIKDHNDSIPVVMITGEASVEYAIAALREHAYDFIRKPFEVDELLNRVQHALTHQRAVHALRENAELKSQLKEKFRSDNMIGSSSKMEAVYRMIERVANTDSTVLVLGESGTGKELVARALHFNSRRAHMPFVAVNCAALPEQLMESELFGHRKGAFTGAAFDKVGLFQHADGGTIFLDEIGSMAMGLQGKLLRFLQDREMRRVGDNNTTKVDVRVLVATNEPLLAKLKDKTFREDLYYRVSVIPIQLPPLRERVEDVPLLVGHFMEKFSKQLGRTRPTLSEEVMEVLKAHTWPGNVRELQNAIERVCVLCEGGAVELRDLPERVLLGTGKRIDGSSVSVAFPAMKDELVREAAAAMLWAHGSAPVSLKEFLHQQEVRYIEQVIKVAGGDKARAAEMIGIGIATLYRKLAAETD